MKRTLEIKDQIFKIPTKSILYTAYGFDGCPYSENTALILNNLNKNKTLTRVFMINYNDTINKKNSLHEFLTNNTNMKSSYNTWPCVFYKGEFIGGNSELVQHLHNHN